jgi:hypothetical protein
MIIATRRMYMSLLKNFLQRFMKYFRDEIFFIEEARGWSEDS